MENKVIVITVERYNELLIKEFVYNFRREQLKKSNYVHDDDKILYELNELAEDF